MSAVQRRAKRAYSGQQIAYGGKLVDPRYRLRNSTIIAWLKITEAEMRGVKLRHLVNEDIQRERERTRDERRRREAGAVDRSTYLAGSLSRQRPWEADGVSRRTWERRRKAQNASATSRDASPPGCMVVEPPLGALAERVGRASGVITPTQVVSPPPSTTAPVRPLIQLDLFETVESIVSPLADAGVLEWREIGGSAPAVIGAAVRAMACRGVQHQWMADRAGWSTAQLSNVLCGRFGASPDRAKALVETMRELVAAA
jgi:hypothetical protein